MDGGGGKRPGKVEWVDRRRPATRRSGYNATAAVEYTQSSVETIILESGSLLVVEMSLPAVPPGTILGFGGWIYADLNVQANLTSPAAKWTLRLFEPPDWGKFGSQWYSGEPAEATALLEIVALGRAEVALTSVVAGVVEHPYLDGARPGLMKNMHDTAPEANFIVDPTPVAIRVEGSSSAGAGAILTLKSCNRCGRFLPINISNERNHLSFTNHCSAPHVLPCSHSGFGKIRSAEGGPVLELEYGFQLECRFCKKFEVNSPHNPQRNPAQMKEDAARRRGFELLLTDLFGGSDSLLYRKATGGRELADDVYERFDGRCFKCGIKLGPKEMRLDHTRPLALLWPLDGSATALCTTHNSEKRDRAPADYYDADQIERLALLTGLPLDQLLDPSPNRKALELLLSRLDWFFDVFLRHPEMQKVHDGKLAADLMVKALNKVMAHAALDVDLLAIYRARGGPPLRDAPST